MSQQQDLRAVINSLPDTESTADLQGRLKAAGIDTDMSAVPAGEVPETFRIAMSSLLDRPIGDLSVDEIRAITADVKATSVALEPRVTAASILEGFKKLDDGVIEITLPVGTSIQEAGEILNAAAREKGMEYPVFNIDDADRWAKNEADSDLQTEPGKAYQFKIPMDSVSKTRASQVKDQGVGVPLGAIAIAEACERFNTENNGSLFKDADGDMVWVRGSAPGVALGSILGFGVGILGCRDDCSRNSVAFAPSVGARN